LLAIGAAIFAWNRIGVAACVAPIFFYADSICAIVEALNLSCRFAGAFVAHEFRILAGVALCAWNLTWTAACAIFF
jgi:hypothetical protein